LALLTIVLPNKKLPVNALLTPDSHILPMKSKAAKSKASKKTCPVKQVTAGRERIAPFGFQPSDRLLGELF